MAAIGKFLPPVAGPSSVACPGIEWIQGPNACPESLAIFCDIGSGATNRLAVDFHGRGKVGTACGGSDTYVNVQTNTFVTVDLWGAYRDGIWTSSVTIACYVGRVGAAASPDIDCHPESNSAAVQTKNVTNDATACGTVVKATITVNADGTFSIT